MTNGRISVIVESYWSIRTIKDILIHFWSCKSFIEISKSLISVLLNCKMRKVLSAFSTNSQIDYKLLNNFLDNLLIRDTGEKTGR